MEPYGQTERLGLRRIGRALVTSSSKVGLLDLGLFLRRWGVEFVSTGGTAGELRATGCKVTEVADLTGFPEVFDGRVKTLHPMVHGPILFDRTNDKHVSRAAALGMKPIDLVVVDLYPFMRKVVDGAMWQECTESIDIGGSALIRAAAKNYQSVAVLADPVDYRSLDDELSRHNGATSLEYRFKMMQKAFVITARYDSQIAAAAQKVRQSAVA
jgi:phosphoribosylaminoimidazolecarboxamide formyltransferase/IMP cyclohydrolase